MLQHTPSNFSCNTITGQARELEILQEYETLKKTPKNSSIDRWLPQWETVIVKGRQLGMPQMHTHRPVFDFLLAVKPVDPYWQASQYARLQAKLMKGKTYLSYFDNTKE